MNKSIIILLSLLLSFSTGYSQTKFGIKAGMNISNAHFEFNYLSNYTNKIAYNAGVLSEITISKLFIFRPELIYSKKGFGFPSAGTSGSGNLNYHYINMPVLLGIKPIKQLSILLGPEFGYLLKAISRFDKVNHDVSQNFQKVDLGLSAGLCYYIKSNFAVEMRYTKGFNLLLKSLTWTDSNGNYLSTTRSGNNRLFQIGFIYYPFLNNSKNQSPPK